MDEIRKLEQLTGAGINEAKVRVGTLLVLSVPETKRAAQGLLQSICLVGEVAP